MKRTKKEYEQYLNNLGDECLSPEALIIGGKYRRMKYGTALRKYDPIRFELGYIEYVNEEAYKEMK